MFLRAVALVPGKPITFIHGVKGHHQFVPEHFGHDGGRGHRNAFPVTLAQANLLILYTFEGETVNQDQVRYPPQAAEGADHGRLGGTEDIVPVDLLAGGAAQAHGHGLGGDGPDEVPADRGGQKLRVVNPAGPEGGPAGEEVGGEDDGGGHDGPEESPPAHFIDAGDRPPALPEKTFLDPKVRHRSTCASRAAQ